MDSNRNEDVFLAPETGIWLAFSAKAVPGHGFDDAPLSAASLSRLGSWPRTAPTTRHAGPGAAEGLGRVRAVLRTLFQR